MPKQGQSMEMDTDLIVQGHQLLLYLVVILRSSPQVQLGIKQKSNLVEKSSVSYKRGPKKKNNNNDNTMVTDSQLCTTTSSGLPRFSHFIFSEDWVRHSQARNIQKGSRIISPLLLSYQGKGKFIFH